MSNLDRRSTVTRCGGLGEVVAGPVAEVFTGREVVLGEASKVRRLLPNLGRRLVGPWCFVDHYGPDDITAAPGMQVPPHPHIGLRTVSWLLDGEVHHRDSLGNDQVLRPGQLGLMTAGRGITHAEQSPAPHPGLLHGVQLWIALPDADRGVAAGWEFHPSLPVRHDPTASVTVLLGDLAGASSPASTYSPIVGADVTLAPGGRTELPLTREFEHAVLVVSGWAEVAATRLEPGAMLYLGSARTTVTLTSEPGARLILLGGEPFAEQIVMWWNFVARTAEEIEAARTAWLDDTGWFPDVAGYDGYRLPAPDLPPGRLRPGGATRG